MTIEELRKLAWDTFDAWACDIVDGWPDAVFKKASKSKKDPLEVLLERARAEEATKNPKEATGGTTEAHRAPRTARSTPRPRKQEGSVSVALGEVSVLLTPKQLEFMERLSECPDWEKYGSAGEYTASEYAQELSDTMDPMSMGAVLTTLREKGLLQTEKRRVGAIKCCMFKLTDLGVQVYNKLAERGGMT